MNKNIAFKTGTFLGLTHITIFLGIYFFQQKHFYKWFSLLHTTLIPLMYVFFAGMATYGRAKIQLSFSFREAFSTAFISLMGGGIMFVLFSYLFFNFIQPTAANLFKDQMLSTLEQAQVPLKQQYNPEFLKAYNESVNIVKGQPPQALFRIERLVNALIGLIFPAYALISLVISLIFRKRKPQ